MLSCITKIIIVSIFIYLQDSVLCSNPSSLQNIGQYSVNSGDLTCDLASDLPCDGVSLNPSTSSTCSVVEDNSNHEFYYDDEFTVPFDVRLDAGDKFDRQSLLTLAQGEYNIHGASMSDDDVDSIDEFLHCLSTSKSDSCLYQIELDSSAASHDYMCHSHNVTAIPQHEMISSADFSLVCQDKPLFTSSYTDSVELHTHNKHSLSNLASVDSLAAGQSMNGSYIANSMAPYSYDFTANKDRYTLLFDKSPNSKVSTDDVSRCQESFLRSPDNLSNQSHYSTTSAPIKLQNTGEKDSMVEKPYKRQQSLTSWGEMKKDKNILVSSVQTELTSWKNLYESQSKLESQDSSVEMKTSLLGSTTDNYVVSDKSGSDSDVNKRHSGTLLQIYQRLKSPDAAGLMADMESYKTVSLSSETLQRMIGTWSVSPCSEKSQLWTSDDTNNDVPLTSWNTFKNLTGSHQCINNSVSSESVDLGESYLNSTTTSEGSYQLLGQESTPPLYNKLHSRDACVQTSQRDGGKGPVWTMNKSLQTSLIQQHEFKERIKHNQSHTRSRAKSLDDSTENVIKSLDKLFYPNATLPDLSFLNSDCTNAQQDLTTNALEASHGTSKVSHRKDKSSISSPKIMCSQTAVSVTSANNSRRHVSGVKAGLPSLPNVMRLKHKNSLSSMGSCSSSSSGIDTGFSESPPISDTTLNSTLDTTTSGSNNSQVMGQANQQTTHKKSDGNMPCLFTEYRSKDVKIPTEVRKTCSCYQMSLPTCHMTVMTQSQPVYANNDVLESSELTNPMKMRLASTHPHYHHYSKHPLGSKPMSLICHNSCPATHCCGTHGLNPAQISRELMQKEPLKSCLVKRRRTSRGRRMVKHRSFSDPRDLSVMKYSLEGQARYILNISHVNGESYEFLIFQPSI